MNKSFKINVLLVDDRPENLTALEAILGNQDLNLTMATSGEAALRLVLKEDFAAILLDVQMPGMDGFETARIIRQRERSKSTPIIFITAMSKTDIDVFRGYETGAVDYILKPIVPEILRAKVSVFADLYRKTEEIRLQTQKLALLNSELEAFSYTVSHDLCSPLNTIIGFADLLVKNCWQKLDEKERQWLNFISKSTWDMNRLIEDILVFSKTSKNDIKSEIVDLSEIAGEICQRLKLSDSNRDVRFIIPHGISATGDAAMLRIVMSNLLGNAWKYTSKHQRAVIEFGSIMPDDGQDRVIFFVQDDGAGFNLVRAKKLFMPFERFHSASEFSGTGLGLATVQRIIHKHGGTIWAESEKEKGSSFFFTI